jgi:NhaP-type Na+/H+ or K+/H+ antiporter
MSVHGQGGIKMSANLIALLTLVGALCFGIVVGWVTYRTLRRTPTSGLSDIATVIGALGGATVTALFSQGTGAFGAYCIGLIIGFFGYLKFAAEKNAPDWMGSEGVGNPGRSSGTTSRTPHDPPEPNH